VQFVSVRLDDGALAASAGAATVSVAPAELSLVPPARKDRVRVVVVAADAGGAAGAPAGLTGTLIGIDEADGIVKADASGDHDIKILDMSVLAKLAT
jgi:hypothetical protein